MFMFLVQINEIVIYSFTQKGTLFLIGTFHKINEFNENNSFGCVYSTFQALVKHYILMLFLVNIQR